MLYDLTDEKLVRDAMLEACKKILSLMEQLKEAQIYKADAERYQVLKKVVYPNYFVVNMNIGHDWIEVNNKELDEVIDQAMNESN